MGNKMHKKRVDLFKGLIDGSITPGKGGFILNTNLHTRSNYAIFEIIAIGTVNNILPYGDGVTFHGDGFKVYVIFEPKTYAHKFKEPYLREAGERVPLRWTGVRVLDLPKKDRILISEEPYISFGSFTVNIPGSGSFVDYFSESPETKKYMLDFFGNILYSDFSVPKENVRTCVEHISHNLNPIRREAVTVSQG